MVDTRAFFENCDYVQLRTRKFLFAKKSHETYHKYGRFSTIWELANCRSYFGKKIVAFYV